MKGISHFRDAQAAFTPSDPLPRTDNVVPFSRNRTELRAQQLTYDLNVIADRIREYERDLAALKRLRDTKAEALDLCMREIARG